MKSKEIGKLVGSIVACQVAGGIGSIFTAPAISTWYATLEKPAFTPPNSVFAPVWITLYLLMAIAVFLIWRKGLDEKVLRRAFLIFWGQLIINILWSVVFFGLKSPLAGVITIIILWFAILLTLITFFKNSNVAGGLLVPYIVWVSIATYLNVGIWILNP